ncbi:MAG: hypothetical protein IPO92_16535 [Saprospiraceae bacterium]|nr:hypothetical protein [Saprospiraceae bacterium]
MAQCDNIVKFPSSNMNVVCGFNPISQFQWAGDYNVTQGYEDQSLVTYSSSVPTDYLTLRKAADNSVIVHGITPLVMVYSASYGNIEMHINTNSTCNTENINRTTAILIECGCNNAVPFPSGIISLSPGLNTIATNQWAGDYNVTTNYIDGALCTYTSSVSSDYITLRQASDNAIIKKGQSPLILSYDASMGDIEMHINKDINCVNENVNRTTTIDQQSVNIYTGGNGDGYGNHFFAKRNITDARAFRGHNGDGFAIQFLFKISTTDLLAFHGGLNDGFDNELVLKKSISDNFAFRGGHYDGFANDLLAKRSITDELAFHGGNADGYHTTSLTNKADFAFRGGNGDGFRYKFLSAIDYGEEIVFHGGNSDGFGIVLLEKNMISDPLVYHGGSSDGYNLRLLPKLNITDNIAFIGGQADGYHYILMESNNVAFRGGNGDGFQGTFLLVTEMAFSGGEGDGFIGQLLPKAIISDALAFLGGNGDGYNLLLIEKQSILDPLAAKGGSGDGFNRLLLEKQSIIDPLTAMGGRGDGYNRQLHEKQNILDPIAALGGNADGYHHLFLSRLLIDDLACRGGIGRGDHFDVIQCGSKILKWTGDGYEWEFPNHWDCGFVPDINTTVIIPTGLIFYPIVKYNHDIKSIILNPNTTLDIITGGSLNLKIN